jgi:hypothetical protein
MAIGEPSPSNMHPTPHNQTTLLTQEVYFDSGLDA